MAALSVVPVRPSGNSRYEQIPDISVRGYSGWLQIVQVI